VILLTLLMWIFMYLLTNLVTADKTVVDANAYHALDHDRSKACLNGWHRRILILNLLVWPWNLNHWLKNRNLYKVERIKLYH